MAEGNPNQNPETNIDIQAEIEKARKQERDKLHADIEKLKNDLADKAKTCNDNYITISDLQKKLTEKETELQNQIDNNAKELQGIEDKLNKAKEDGKMEANKDLDTLKQELEDYKAKLAKAEKDFADYKTAEEIKSYRSDKVKDIDDEFKELVKGATKEEIDASYDQIKALQESVKVKYGQKAGLPTPPPKSKTPKKISDLADRFGKMSIDEYKQARQNNFK